MKIFSVRALIVLAVGMTVAGCVSTQEMQLAPNMVRLDTSARGALFVGHAGDVTLQRAAQVTVKNGYQFFRLEQAQMGQGSQLVGVSSFGSASAYQKNPATGRQPLAPAFHTNVCPNVGHRRYRRHVSPRRARRKRRIRRCRNA